MIFSLVGASWILLYSVREVLLCWYGAFVGMKHKMVWISVMPILDYLKRVQKIKDF